MWLLLWVKSLFYLFYSKFMLVYNKPLVYITHMIFIYYLYLYIYIYIWCVCVCVCVAFLVEQEPWKWWNFTINCPREIERGDWRGGGRKRNVLISISLPPAMPPHQALEGRGLAPSHLEQHREVMEGIWDRQAKDEGRLRAFIRTTDCF